MREHTTALVYAAAGGLIALASLIVIFRDQNVTVETPPVVTETPGLIAGDGDSGAECELRIRRPNGQRHVFPLECSRVVVCGTPVPGFATTGPECSLLSTPTSAPTAPP